MPAECLQNRAGINRLLNLQIAWNWAYPITAFPQTRTRDRVQFRDTTRHIYEAALRARIKNLPANDSRLRNKLFRCPDPLSAPRPSPRASGSGNRNHRKTRKR
ncbi:hypothetical protein OPIT5_17855 [Opitutaceae bacterium TAV5]|nr:hypothetical protein OPIT5_17855 [Opitutaceae bacterium TAV5]